jgi:hypothetical protein
MSARETAEVGVRLGRENRGGRAPGKGLSAAEERTILQNLQNATLVRITFSTRRDLNKISDESRRFS